MPFGGITVLLGGDFRQILPVIPRSQRSEVVSACITRSRIWRHVKMFVLEQNMWLHQKTIRQPESFTNFAKWVLDIGDEKGTNGSMSSDNEEAGDITIPAPFCTLSNSNCVDMLIESTYPNLLNSFKSVSYLSERAILTPTNQVVDYLNSLIVTKIPGDSHTYYSIDTAEEFGGTDEQLFNAFPVEYLNSIKLPGIPPYDLTLKAGIVVMLIRNLNQILGLCNGTRMIIRMCLKHSVMCEVISGSPAGTTHFIPRIDMCPSDTTLPFKLCRKQIPLQVCFAMTINKSQGQSLKKVGLYLPKPVFCHGQLYVVVSRVTSPAGLSIFIEGDDGKMKSVTKNVVYEEVFYNLHVPAM